MRQEAIAPTEEKLDSPVSETKLTHPAFGQIRASRVSGGATLYGSDFNHQHFIAITICRSEQHRGLSRDWHHAREELIDVSLSEAQWATFVSSLNMGGGVPCTLSHIGGKGIPEIKVEKSKAEQFAQEMDETLLGIQAKLKGMAAGLDGAMPKTKVAELRQQLDTISFSLTNSTGFVASQFSDHMEQTVEAAKVEVNAYLTGAVQRAGLNAIAEKGMLALTLNDGKGGTA